MQHVPAVIGRRQVLQAALTLTCALAMPIAHGAIDTPIHIVVGTPAGGAVDVYGRTIARGLSEVLGRTVLVENRSGANGNISAQHVLQQPADGNTLWVGTQAMVEINPSAFEQNPWQPGDFIPIIRGIEAPLVLVTNPSVPAKDFKSLIEWLRKNPGTGYASFSPGTPSHFLGYQLADHYKLDMVHIPYRGSAPQTADLAAGHSVVGFSQIQTTRAMLQDHRLNAIATTGAERSRFLPDVPTLQELGLPEMNTTIWFGIMAPAKTPPDVVEALTKALVKVHQNPEVRQSLESAGYDVSGETGASFADSIKTSRERWAKLVKASGFKAAQ